MPQQDIVFHGLLKQIPWGTFDRLVDRHNGDWDGRVTKSRPHLIAMLYAQFCGARGLREIEASLKSHAGKLYHLGGCTISKSALSTANASRPVEVFAGLLSALIAQLQNGYRRKIRDCVRLVDSTSVRLSSLSGDWATFSTGVCGAKAHIIYDPDADQPLYLMVTPSNVNDITAAKAMPIEAGATYVFDLGYYDYAWWAELDAASCRIVTRFKSNTPLAVISSYSQMLRKEITPEDSRYKLLEKITKQTFRASEIVNNLLNFSRTGAAELANIDVNRVVEETLSLVAHPLKTSQIQVVKNLGNALPSVRGSANKLQQVFLNLFLNARDAMPSGGMLEVKTAAHNGSVEIEIVDTGAGIPREHIHKIFDPFFTTKATGRGTGLGLSVSYGIIKEHAGKIDVRSTPGKGTSFHVEFPAVRKAVHV